MVPHSHEFTFAVFSAKPVLTRPVQGTNNKHKNIRTHTKDVESTQNCLQFLFFTCVCMCFIIRQLMVQQYEMQLSCM